ncbi:hypothetical protein OG21DRAFT_1472561 [Imleria badia]|nr:hypothetical protein OG21DRAFT_1472561 [Imleria badia]
MTVSPMTTPSTMNEHSTPIEIDTDIGREIRTMSFTPNGEYLVGGGYNSVQVWKAKDGTQTTTITETGNVTCLAVSQDGTWIAGGRTSELGNVIVWDIETYEKVFTLGEESKIWSILGVDFSPDSSRLVTASSNSTATIWDVATRQRLQTLRHDHPVTAAKYSPQGDRIATATSASIQLWDSNGGNLLVDTPAWVTPVFNTGLLWFKNRLFAISNSTIKEFDIFSGSMVSERPVSASNHVSCIALPQHAEFIAYSTNDTVTFWDTSTHILLGLIQRQVQIDTIVFSPGDRSLAINEGRKITIINFKDVPPLPFVHINDTVLDSWKRDQLADTEASLTETISNPEYKSHHALANRALVRARLQLWDLATDDAEKSIDIRPSVVGCIAKSVALIGSGRKEDVHRVFDLAFRHCAAIDVDLLLLIKAVVLCMAGEHNYAVSRVSDLIATVRLNSIYCLVQAYMCLLLGNSYMERRDYEGAIQSFKRARAQMRNYVGPLLIFISLISGWKFDGLGLMIQQRLCEALYAAGCTKDAGESLLKLVDDFGEEVYRSGPTTDWVSDFTHRCLSVPERDVGTASKAIQHDNSPVTPNSPRPTPLLTVWTKVSLMGRSWEDALVTASGFISPRFTIYRAICEHLEATDRIGDATDCFQEMLRESAVETDVHDEQAEWALGAKWALYFRQLCAEKLEHLGDVAADSQEHDEAVAQYSTALSLNPLAPANIFIKRSKIYTAKGLWEDALKDATQVTTLNSLSPWGHEKVLMEWAKSKLADSSWKNTFMTAGGFELPRFTVYRALCDCLETLDRITDATESFHEMANELARQTNSEQALWIRDFKFRCRRKLEDLGDLAMRARQHDEAIARYSAALTLSPTNPQDLHVKRSKAHANMGMWKDALNDANEVITLDPSSPLGYERQHAALRVAGCYDDASHAFETMLFMMSQSPDPEIRERSRQYVNPAQTEATIRGAIENAILESPLVLIHTHTGRLLDKSGQSSSFESQPIFHELVSTMTTDIDRARIEQEVRRYYRYAMFSHKWEDNEPLFEKVIHMVVYDLEESTTHSKLQMFCKIVRDAGLHWAWSDTCCINKADPSVLQEALVSMFQWYQASAMTLVLLRDVLSPSGRGDLVKSIWNTRSWTFQEYHASKVVRFYNKDWTLYRNFDIPNHKESPDIISEMEEATGVSAHALMALRPGLEDIREKLRLASTRQTTRAEDAAYSLLGIFSLSLPVVYGEGDKALGRLLAQLLMSSGDTSILAWTGRSCGFNTCLPASIAVFSQLATSHIPLAIPGTDMEMMIARMQTPLLNPAFLMTLYDRLHELPIPLFVGKRMKLPCLVFKLGPTSVSRSRSERVFRAQTAALGIVEIKTEEDLSRMDSLYLVHPWIDFLLDRQPVGSVIETIPEGNTDDRFSSMAELPSLPGASNISSAAPQTRTARLASRLGLSFGGRTATRPQDTTSLQPPSTLAQTDKQMRAFQVIARLRRPFGALLLTPNLGSVAAYRRVASESLITVQVEEITPTILNKLVDSVRVLDVL